MTRPPTYDEFAERARAAGLDPADLLGVFTAGRENGHRRPRGYAPWRPQAKTRALLDQIAAVLDEYRDHLPLSVRQIFYRLVAAHGYPKDENAYNNLADKLVRARRARLIDFDAIRDDQVVSAGGECFDGVGAFLDDVGGRIRNYRRDRQAGQAVRVELWSEAAGMLQQLRKVADRYSVPVYSAGGFVSLTGIRGIADRALARDVPTIMLHVGDYDPSGESIFASVAEDVAAFVEADRVIQTLSFDAIRVALTGTQILAHNLPVAPAKKTDGRSATWKGGTCQLEALPPDVLAGIVDEAIRDHLSLDLVAEQVEAEERDRIELTRALPSGEVGS